MPPIPDHPLRYATVNELHARPFPAIEVPSTAVYWRTTATVRATFSICTDFSTGTAARIRSPVPRISRALSGGPS
jgi:hypothetical protein